MSCNLLIKHDPWSTNPLAPPVRRFAVLFVVAALLGAFDASAASIEEIQVKVSQYLKNRALRSAQWGIEVVDPTNNQVVLSINSEKTFTPASVMKVLTTATAIEKLGPDFKYKTGAYTNGILQPDGTLTGNLILVGRGDPNLMSPAGDGPFTPAFEDLALKLKNSGVKVI